MRRAVRAAARGQWRAQRHTGFDPSHRPQRQTTKLPNLVNMQIRKDQHIRGRDSSGGGYGDPLTRDPLRVLTDVLEGYELMGKARDVYGVSLPGASTTTASRSMTKRRKRCATNSLRGSRLRARNPPPDADKKLQIRA